jgi:alanine dehydrogenase
MNTAINVKIIMWIKVKDPIQDEYGNKRENDSITWTYLKHPAQYEYGNQRENDDITYI